ncbi:MAG TPA: hypothetical protein VF637_07565 [Sphingomicrobium sp.]
MTKPPAAPRALAAGVPATAAHLLDYDGASQDYDSGAAKFAFSKTIYGHASVKAALKAAQHDKCCYCEGRFDANYGGDVEHYRPKGAIGSGKSKILPGYYWLAYLWPNLFYACADCNQYRKRAAFPLANEAQRVRNHHGDIALEDPLILDPSGPRDPREHIKFNGDVPVWKSPAGKETIGRIKLDREGLLLSRRQHFRLLDAYLTIIERLQHSADPAAVTAVADARRELNAAILPEAVFSAASSDYLAPHRALWNV